MDQFGGFSPDLIFKYFKEQNIDTSGIVLDRTGAKTQIAISEIIGPEAGNIIFYRDDNVADLKLAPSDVKEEYIAGTKILNISGTAFAGSPSREAAFIAMEYAMKHGVTICMDVDYRPHNWRSAEETAIYYSKAAEKCDLILGTREEFNMMEAIVDPGNRDDQKTADRLFQGRTKAVLVKHGKDGSVCFTKDGQVINGCVIPAQVVNTFGAGDSYAAAFLYGVLSGASIQESMRLGAAASSIVVSRNSCSDALPTIGEINTLLQNYLSAN